MIELHSAIKCFTPIKISYCSKLVCFSFSTSFARFVKNMVGKRAQGYNGGKELVDFVSELLCFFARTLFPHASNIWIQTLKLGLLDQKFYLLYPCPWLNIFLSMRALTADK